MPTYIILFILFAAAYLAIGVMKPSWLPSVERALRTKNILIALVILAPVAIGTGYAFQKYKESSGGERLYRVFKSIDGNQDKPGFDEQEYIRGKLLSRCKVNGKPRGYYGWFEYRTVLLEGERVRDENPTRMYIFAVMDDEDHGSAIWRGGEYKQAVIENMQRTCD